MTARGTIPVRLYTEDQEFLLLNRGTGTPADALRKIIKMYKIIIQIAKEDRS